ncbi:unnamed protein product [Leptosia nina]|uniref:Uncharacterized protein n=1 Tax=Leptosia nina TaxID=320188 RepID=A0AAV1JIY3_9NEOP
MIFSIAFITAVVHCEPPVYRPSYQNGYTRPVSSYLPPATGYTPPNNYLPPNTGYPSDFNGNGQGFVQGHHHGHGQGHGHNHGHGDESEVVSI